jgi:hypothetical protein
MAVLTKVPLALESEIQTSIIRYLYARGITFWRINTTGIYDVAKKKFRPSPTKGVSDILGVLPNGRFLAIEVKSAKGAVTKEQQAFIDKVNASHGLAFVARSIRDVEVRLDEYFRDQVRLVPSMKTELEKVAF